MLGCCWLLLASFLSIPQFDSQHFLFPFFVSYFLLPRSHRRSCGEKKKEKSFGSARAPKLLQL
jgi:hypothetical protein